MKWRHDESCLYIGTRRISNPEEFKAAGLNKLLSEELEKLNAWLQGYREATEKVTEKKTEKRVARSFFHHEPIVSGDHPGAAVVWAGLGYKMRIQGVAEFYVNPVKTP